MLFLSTSKHKHRELLYIDPTIELWTPVNEIHEIQSIDPNEVIRHKLNQFYQTAWEFIGDKEFVIEDTGLHLDCMNGFPGPLCKCMLRAIGPQGLYDICKGYNQYGAVAVTVMAYHDGDGTFKYFWGSVVGEIVPPTGPAYGYDTIFKPNDSDQTYREMGEAKKVLNSPRTQAFKAVLKYREQNG